MTERKPSEQRYRVVGGISTRREPNLACEEWITFEAGEMHGAQAFPAHLDLAALVASGHLQPVTEEGT